MRASKGEGRPACPTLAHITVYDFQKLAKNALFFYHKQIIKFAVNMKLGSAIDKIAGEVNNI